MNNYFRLNYIKCPGCKNTLDLSFINKTCPNPLCGFQFEGLELLLDQNDNELHKALIASYKGDDDRQIQLLATAVRFNIGSYLSHFVACKWGAHYQTLFKDFIILYLDDINILKMVLLSDVIKLDKGNVVVSENGYKMFPDLYNWLMRVHNPDIRNFLRLEFPGLYKKWLIMNNDRFIKPRPPKITNQQSLV
ncbi:MAG: hypothetical protein WC682_05345 [Parcubacteria group bacterium]|jgi:hypothetical protein